MKTLAVKVAKKLLKSEAKVGVDPFDVISRTRIERDRDVMPQHQDVEAVERAYNRLYFFDPGWRSQQLQLLVMDPDTLSSPKGGPFVGGLTHLTPDMSAHFGGVFSAYLTSMLVMFTQSATRPDLAHLSAVEGRLERLERAMRWAALEQLEKKAEVDWDVLEVVLPKAASALGWKVEWKIDREKSEVVGRVAGVDYTKLARQRLDFYEQVASAVDKETFKAVSFELEPAE